jgi:hypothetical protein
MRGIGRPVVERAMWAVAVDGEHALCLRAQELAPRKSDALACRPEASLAQKVADSGAGDGEAQPAELDGDPLVTPARVFAREG